MPKAIKKIIPILTICGQLMYGLGVDREWFLKPMSVDYLYLAEGVDLTQKGNIYERTFRMPLDLLRVWSGNYIDIYIDFDWSDDPSYFKVEYSEYYTLPVKNTRDFIYRLNAIRTKYESWSTGSTEQKEATMQLLEAYHPNQYFRFKITIIPLGSPQDKQEEIIEFPLYFVGSRQKYQTRLRIEAKTWRRTFVRIEALEDTVLPKGIRTIAVIKSGSYK